MGNPKGRGPKTIYTIGLDNGPFGPLYTKKPNPHFNQEDFDRLPADKKETFKALYPQFSEVKPQE